MQNAIGAACVKYDAVSPDVHQLGAIATTASERMALIEGYDKRTAAMKRLLAKIIETLPAADLDLCPFCSLDTNPDLDHFLPKARFPEFSLHARNLVPICTPCNRKKANAVKSKTTGQRLFLHPSVEPSNNAVVLEASLSFKKQGLSVSYHVDGGGVLSQKEGELVRRHFDRLGLSARYSRRAQSYLASFKASIAGKPSTVVARTLKQKISTASFGEPANGWRPALFRAIALNEAAILAWLQS
ncbi:HNH endonuclease signature motif containing protein (plasmid) [Bradyrhizobium sp. 62B]|uniref:HNH endonuclease n=1 Tax=Bradyrhizobium sp. 62B TaxID=2898442 RepID=UPI002557DAA2|nr:HNH endonuclease signature motif containing protein [Bradyrhizobium sp. 62B]